MIPSVLAWQLKTGVNEFIRTTFPITTPSFHNVIEDFLHRDGSVFLKPFLSLKMPFRVGDVDENFFADVPMKFLPHKHQEKAFKRVQSGVGRSTIVATGTGSGKTECFLYPILDHCYRNRDKKGVKAIIIYPMNALAEDQARRIAGIVDGNDNLRGNVTAGLFVGQTEKEPTMQMTREKIITNKETMRLSPPDILLTNYKMLDFLLIRPRDKMLWIHNEAETLRYLVVDELHTFDGAKGTDLACLIRRLKARLKTPRGSLCCVGTSATLGNEEKDRRRLIDYASQVFGESFDDDAIITEVRQEPWEFLGNTPADYMDVIPESEVGGLDPLHYDSYPEYVAAQYRMWFDEDPRGDFTDPEWKIELGRKLKRHVFFQNLVKKLNNRVMDYDGIISEMSRGMRSLRKASPRYQELLLISLVALISEARNENNPTKEFLRVRIQLWLRELRRMVGSIGDEPRLHFADDLEANQLQSHLPVINCRECGATGWAALKKKHDDFIIPDLERFYHAYFKKHPDPKVVFIFPDDDGRFDKDPMAFKGKMCSKCLSLIREKDMRDCPMCDGHLAPVYIPYVRRKVKIRDGKSEIESVDTGCPVCGAAAGLSIIGSRAASIISVLISQLFASDYNDDKKLLTFSDSVQDAAHRAGFFSARTYRFNLRSAIQQFVMDGGDDLPLPDFTDRFCEYWLGRLGEDKFIATFLPPDLDWLNDYEMLTKEGRLPPGSNLVDEVVRKRLSWEICSEYGFMCRIGRTLEKMDCSVGVMDRKQLDVVVDELHEILRNEIGWFKSVSREKVLRFIAGFIVNLKNRGGIYHFTLHNYITSHGYNESIFNRQRGGRFWMPKFAAKGRIPSFLTTRRDYGRFEKLADSHSTGKNWTQDWAMKLFAEEGGLVANDAGYVYDQVMKHLTGKGIFNEYKVGKDKVWAINPDGVRIQGNVAQLRCKKCGSSVSVGATEIDIWEGSTCLRYDCHGEYERQPSRDNYYKTLYEKGNIERVFSFEHTGLLTRDERNELEKKFKVVSSNKRPWFPNVLSCTPTLEMGIDVGDLSSLILCSVPPDVSNYLQRIGRSGRSDGNSLDLTVANGRNHDLYFYFNPTEMISGEVKTPGVFLNAPAVLERQITAFCLDNWVALDEITESNIPNKIGNVLKSIESEDRGVFPQNLIDYIRDNRQDMVKGFFDLFSDDLTDRSKEHIEEFVQGEGQKGNPLTDRITDGFKMVKLESDSLQKKVKSINNAYRKKQKDKVKDKNYKKDLELLDLDRKALKALVKSIRERNTYNFLSDKGLIPNYAFPEIGVILNSIIRKSVKKSENLIGNKTFTYRYERPAASAISELAPSNSFYAGGRQVRIDQVDMTLSEFEEWRFCGNCVHMEQMEQVGLKEETKNCPKCGSSLWADEGQKKKLLRMRQVFSTSDDHESRIRDDSDNRELVFYNKKLLLDFEKIHIEKSYKVEKDIYPFGFEYINRVTFREMNFGQHDEMGTKFMVAGDESPRKGFALCKHCGKVRDESGKIQHDQTCKYRSKPDDVSLTDCVYLYREFTSEAIRILLPMTTFSGSNRKLHSFIAALQLGLKEKFQGKIDHIRVMDYEDPIPDTNYKKKYLALYDNVPGGTGYLKELLQEKDKFFDILDQALKTIRNCSCNQDPDKDGCYRCLFAFKNSRFRDETSRKMAEDILTNILKHRERIVEAKDLEEIVMAPIFDSELEASFVETLKNIKTEDKPIRVRKEIVGGKLGYYLRVGDHSYFMRPQVFVGGMDGKTPLCKVDFLITPARTSVEFRPIAIFLDGFLYHKDRVGKDMKQRLALVQSGEYYVWSITWKDLENAEIGNAGHYEDYLSSMGSNTKNYNKMLDGYGIKNFKEMHKKNSFQWLLNYLSDPKPKSFKKLCLLYLFLLLQPTLNKDDAWKRIWWNELGAEYPGPIKALYERFKEPRFLVEFRPRGERDDIHLRLKALFKPEAPKDIDVTKVIMSCYMDDSKDEIEKNGYESGWTGYLRLYNLFQFIPFSFFTCSSTVMDEEYRKFIDVEVPRDTGRELPELTEVLEEVEPAVGELAKGLLSKGWPLPIPGYELFEKGKIVAMAELAWPERKLALMDRYQMPLAKYFEKQGWSVHSLEEVVNNPDLMEKHREAVV